MVAARNVATWLAAREWGGSSKRDAARLYTSPPPRLQLPVESLGSDTSTTDLLKQVVILGFTRCASETYASTRALSYGVPARAPAVVSSNPRV